MVFIFFAGALTARILQTSSPAKKGGPSTQQAIKALPYVTWTEPAKDDEKKQGVTRNLSRACPGLNLVVYQSYPQIYLMDMAGKVLHTWGKGATTNWHHAELMRDGHMLLVDEKNGRLVKMAWDSSEVWSKAVDAHHDVAVSEDERIYTLTQYLKKMPRIKTKLSGVFDHGVAMLSEAGELKKEVLLSKLVFATSIPLEELTFLMNKNHIEGGLAMDAFHANTVEVIDRDVSAGGKKLFGKGDLLVCIRNLNMVCVVDRAMTKIVWHWGIHELDRPHHPSLLENGNILIFDNGTFREYSRILEIDPRTKKIVWEYAAEPKKSFFTTASGSVQRLPNGNTLITDSHRARVFEVTPDGEVVWEYFGTVFKKKKEKKKKRKAIWRVTRISSPDQLARLGTLWKGKVTKP